MAVAGVLLAGLAMLNRRIDRRFDAVDRKFESIDRKFERRFEVVEQQIRALAQDVGNLRQDVGRLQGLVERAYEPDRFTQAQARVRERRPTYGDEPPKTEAAGQEEPGT